MSRDVTRLKVFALADGLVADVYRATSNFPDRERYGLTSQIRRAMISVPTNLVEGASRTSLREYIHFVEVALGSALETRYLLVVAHRLEMLEGCLLDTLKPRFDEVVRVLQGLVTSLKKLRLSGPADHRL